MTSGQDGRGFHLDAATHAALIAHARSDHPFEVCGLLGGVDGRPSRHYRVPNAARSMTFYTMDSHALLAAMRDMDDRDLDLVAIYHSHTHTEAYPSATDVELAFYADAVYLIVSLEDPDRPVVRAFDIVDGTIAERTLLVDGVVDGPEAVTPGREHPVGQPR